ncbi:hypothetical protein I6N98_00430 [Spongiibacter nanhainus]|uniref:Uncharacterized protein n=1 Tax=Spongiibacter nanhainus TaxID=2794344 RepID=A0A7T4R130_9GAMM|nr:DUF6544 family protein [Spongiibacter nanhainus]QQD18379.1 hypothetical protein I6N98_00430 [Spongiibacter nanhainus]
MTKPTLPPLIARFIEKSGADSTISTIRLQQQGQIRMGPDKPWLPFSAEQHISAKAVEFEWRARVKQAPLFWIKVVDAYQGGHGKLAASIWGVIPVAKARGPELDRGEIQRYLAELPWCPSALMSNPSLQFVERNDDTVRVWVGDKDTYVDLIFDEHGDLVSTYSDTRVRDGVGCQPWRGRFTDYQEIGGLRVPRRANVMWQTPDGPFEYWRGEISKLTVVNA